METSSFLIELPQLLLRLDPSPLDLFKTRPSADNTDECNGVTG
jgi:hypothetical protein